MSFKCKIGLHSWDGCKCSECEKTRDEQHDWSIDCEKCSKCGKTRYNQHKWEGCKCISCNKTQKKLHYKNHKWNIKNLECEICHASIPNDFYVNEKYPIRSDISMSRYADLFCTRYGRESDILKALYDISNPGIVFKSLSTFFDTLNPNSDLSGNFDIPKYYSDVKYVNQKSENEDIKKLCEFVRLIITICYQGRTQFLHLDSCTIFIILLWLGDKDEDIILYLNLLAIPDIRFEVQESLKEALNKNGLNRISYTISEEKMETLIKESLISLYNACIIPYNTSGASSAHLSLRNILSYALNNKYKKELIIRNLKSIVKLLKQPEATNYGCGNPWIDYEEMLKHI